MDPWALTGIVALSMAVGTLLGAGIGYFDAQREQNAQIKAINERLNTL